MKLATRSAAAAVAALSTAGVSTLALGVAPAVAVPSDGCGTGDLVAPGVCEQIFTAGGTFTPTATTTKLEVLLVGSGGSAVGRAEDAVAIPATVGYAAAGGGGEVEIVDFSGSTNPVAIAFAGATSATNTVTSGSADAGFGGSTDGGFTTAQGGDSGSGELGADAPTALGAPGAAGGAGDGGAASGANGGAGTVVSTIAASGSLFAGDTRCFGGGGAATAGSTVGTPAAGCGGGSATTAPRANSGGGSGAVDGIASFSGATGIAIVRWNAGLITLSFSANGHGTAPAAQSIVAGTAATTPSTPTADGFEFTGWYTDASLTTLADFSAVNSSTTFVAGWRAALPATGSEPNPVVFASAIVALLGGVGVLVFGAYRRRRQTD